VEALVTTAEAERTSGPERAESSDAAAAAMAMLRVDDGWVWSVVQ
jgi:hypothetical protein